MVSSCHRMMAYIKIWAEVIWIWKWTTQRNYSIITNMCSEEAVDDVPQGSNNNYNDMQYSLST